MPSKEKPKKNSKTRKRWILAHWHWNKDRSRGKGFVAETLTSNCKDSTVYNLLNPKNGRRRVNQTSRQQLNPAETWTNWRILIEAESDRNSYDHKKSSGNLRLGERTFSEVPPGLRATCHCKLRLWCRLECSRNFAGIAQLDLPP
jgi:hypothetical protein